MNSSAPFDTKEQVREAVDIVDLVGGYLPLRRQGRNFVALCPWHDDSRPSLQVNPERQSYKCWVCDIGGDIFSFVMRMENLDFREALEVLAERAGISLQPRPTSAANDSPGTIDKQTMFRAVAWAEELYHRCLLEAPEAQPARDYLAERQINEQSVRDFQLGFAPQQWDWLLKQSGSAPEKSTVLERVGLAVRREAGDGYYDRFRGRLIFPIRDIRGRPIAFGGRVLPQLAGDNAGAKYINTPETPLFSKSREFYGLDRAKDAVAASRKLIVMEGYTDCLMAHQHGVQNVVAVLGTALGERHLPVLKRHSDSITLVLDGDEAGQRRANEILDLFVAHQVELRILTLAQGADPCDVVLKHGGDAFRQLVDQAVDALEHKLQNESKGLDVQMDTHGATQAAERVLSTLAQARPGAGMAESQMLLREQQMLTRTARHFHLPESDLRTRYVALRRKSARKPLAGQAEELATNATEQESHPALSDWPSRERELLELILLDANHLATISPKIDASLISNTLARTCYEQALELWRAGRMDIFPGLMTAAEDAHTKQLLVTLDEQSQAKSTSDPVRRIEDLLEGFAKLSRRRAAVPDATDDDALAQFYSEASRSHRSEYERRHR